MNEMFGQSKEFVSTNQSKITGSPINKRENTLRPPFGIDDPFQILARFKASRQKSVSTGNSSHLRSTRRIPPREYEVNPNMKTMYQYHFNDTGDVSRGHCDNRSIQSLNEDFKRCQMNCKNLLELFKFNEPELPPRKYRSDRNKRISEYAAEIGYVGAKIISHNLHDHSKCGRLPKNCVHYIEF